ncbi:AbrB/MazE/SpoVT family DNA-binding domain-containing protein [Neolewinella sp.]|uniref:AbrB/MazE/SpoVT family DNA-binding domain-containing protein n=1 Tax=Neolewinella sp. TaxID=2993543 RepID=UPI003B51FF3C
MVLTVDKFGRVLIPKKARQALQLDAGSKIELTVDAATKTAQLRPQQEALPPYIAYTDWGWPYLNVEMELPDDFDTVTFIKQTRQEYLDRKLGL